jgi:biopolymer transport protein TolR
MRRHHTELVHATKKKLADVQANINVTPLVDVCLVLLIIFMVVADKLARGKEVSLPKTKFHVEKRDNGDDLIVSVTKSGSHIQIWWDRDPLQDMAALKKRLEEELHRKPRPMFVKADADLTYGQVYPVLIAIHDGGAPGVQLGTQELKETK